MARLAYILFAFVAMLCVALAQDSSSSSTGITILSSTGEVILSSSSSAAALSSSSSSAAVLSSSSSAEASSSSSGSTIDSSSSSELMMSSSSSWVNPLPYVPANWNDFDVYANDTLFQVKWGPKTSDNLMFGVGGSNGFIIDDISGRALRLTRNFAYRFNISADAATEGLYISWDAEGGNTAGSNISTPILAPGNYTIILTGIPDSDQPTYLYYASNRTQFAGGAIVLGSQSAAALQASFLVMAISAFVALFFPKW